MAIVPITELQTRPVFRDLFPMNSAVLEAIKEDMEAHGYDESKPINVWAADDSYIVVDGHTRLEAARRAEIGLVRIFCHEFENEDKAVEYAIACQRNRRNLTDADIVRCIGVLDQRKKAGRPAEKLASSDANFDAGKSATATASLIGVSQAKVERARTVLDHADESTQQEVLSGTMSINKAYNETQERRKAEAEATTEPDDLIMAAPQGKVLLPVLPHVKDRGLFIPPADEMAQIIAASKATFNKQDGDNIEWARWSWNPVTGCLHGCAYCYARDIAARFYEQGFTPTFFPERLAAPKNTRQPDTSRMSEVDAIGWRNVFVCSMADLWGKWVPREIIESVLTQVREQDQWNYLFLTKFPWRYEEFATELPANTWVGTSVDNQAAVARAEKAFKKLVNAGHQGVRWLSVEPMMERLQFSSLSMFDWVVIGGASKSTQTPEFRPPFDWIVDLYQQAREAGCKVYFKTNLLERVREYPGIGEDGE